MGVLWYLPAIVVANHLARIVTVRQAFFIIPHSENDLICYNALIHKIKGQHISHFPQNKPCALIITRLLQDLPRGNAVVRGAV